MKFSLKDFGKKFFTKFFGFEEGIDIADEVALLNRRNIVIKNIIFISNLLYTIILTAIAIIDPKTSTSWVFPVVSVPITFVINLVLKSLINGDPKNKTKQEVAMYLSVLYMFLSSLLIYLRFYNQDGFFMETAAYVLLYYAVVVVSLYQNKKLLKNSFIGVFVLMTLIHLFLTHPITDYATVMDFLRNFFSSAEFADILLRTLVFLLFYTVVYSIVHIGEYIQEERKNELIKRRQVQDDFYSIVNDTFSVMLANSSILVNPEVAHQVLKIANKLAQNYRLNEAETKVMQQYALIHLRYREVETALTKDFEISYNELKEKTELGSQIAKRVQLSQKAEDIVRSYIEGTASDVFKLEINEIQNNVVANLLLISEIYITMRTAKSYKRPYPHQTVISYIQSEMSGYIPVEIIENFIRFNKDYEEVYNNF